MSNFLDGKPRIATEKDCCAPWAGVPNGQNFRCSFCGYKFKQGDIWRCIYTNDIPGAWGNPLVCESCYKGKRETRKLWKKRHDEWKSDKWWWFRCRNIICDNY